MVHQNKKSMLEKWKINKYHCTFIYRFNSINYYCCAIFLISMSRLTRVDLQRMPAWPFPTPRQLKHEKIIANAKNTNSNTHTITRHYPGNKKKTRKMFKKIRFMGTIKKELENLWQIFYRRIIKTKTKKMYLFLCKMCGKLIFHA